MSLAPTPHYSSFRQLVAAQFAGRPSLRDVIASVGFEVLAARYPWTRQNYPHLTSIAGFSILHATEEGHSGQQSDLVETLLEHFLTGSSIALADSDQLSLAPPVIFRPQEQAPVVELRMADLNSDFDEMLATLNESFQQAQISFWSGCATDTHVSRLSWLQQVIKAALLNATERQGLGEDEKRLIYALLGQASNTPAAQGLQVSLSNQGNETHHSLPDLLITAERDEQTIVLWCQPSGTVRGFDNVAAFACALRDEFADHYVFETLSWACCPLEEDPFGYQARQLLNGILQRLDRVQLCAITLVGELETTFSQLSDPSPAFMPGTYLEPPATVIPLPGWLASAADADRFNYHTALLDIGAAQMLAQGASSLDGIEDLQHYAARRLREQMLADHPGTPPCNPDQVHMTISQLVQVSSLGQTRLEYLRTDTLTELAIARLQPGAQEVASAVSRGDGQPIAAWMNLDYINTLIDAVDVGGQYPRYVHSQLQTVTAERVDHFACEWRSALLLSALKAKIDGQLDEGTCQALVGFCHGEKLAINPVNLAPLAFKSVPGTPKANKVHGMFVLEVPATATWVLYRPMIATNPIRAFGSAKQLMSCICAESELRQSVLAWMNDDARPIYANGGFSRPHLHAGLSELAYLLGPGTVLTDEALARLRAPATLAFTPWSGNLDNQLFQAKAQAMLLLASRQSVSNAQQRWALIIQCAWLAFNTVAPLLPGPAGTVAWLAATLISIKGDLSALTQGTREEKLLACTDILFNIAMLLAHGPAAEHPALEPTSHPRPRSAAPAVRRASTAAPQEQPKANDWQAPAEQSRPTILSVNQWAGNQRLGNLPAEARNTLNLLRAKASLDGLTPLATGRFRGLYNIDERYYVKLQDIAFEVEETWSGMRIIGPDLNKGEWTDQWGGQWDGYYIAGREREKGPWVTRWNGEWVLDLHMAGGMPKTRKAIAEQNKSEFLTLQESRRRNDRLIENNEDFIDRYRDMLKDFDEAAIAFRASMAEYPGVARKDLPEAMQVRLRALHAMRNEARTHLHVLTLTYEKQSGLVAQQLELFATMSEPRFARYDRTGQAPYARGQWWEQMLNTDLHLFHRLLDMTDYEALKSQSQRLLATPFGDEQALLYLAYSKNIEAALETHKRLLAVSERLDRHLFEALENRKIQYTDKQNKLETIINTRMYSTVITRAQVLSDLNQLMIKRDQLTSENFDELLRMQADLRNRDFHEALLSHDALAAASLPYDEQAEILGTALREYEISLGKANFLLSLDASVFESTHIEDYIRELTALKTQAERDLSQALSDIEGAASTVRPVTYRVRPGKRKLIRTTRGRAILAEQAEGSDEAVQTDPRTEQAVTHYQQRGDQWEFVTPAATPHGTGYLQRVGNSLLTQKDSRIALASRYTSEPNSLADLMDWHIQDMTDIARQLRAGTEDGHALATRLDQAVSDMQAEKRRLLTQAYLDNQHPDSKALRYLVEQDQIEITPSTSRKRLKANDYLDVYVIHRRQPRQKLWEVHFHYTAADANPREFAKGHVKFWEPRSMSRDEQLQRSLDPAERIRIYRGDLRLEQIEGLIPFPDN
ncbi:hypothetical protein [Pseudomonas sp. PSKL.D1]|uniref:hypothetical protein n=1 Tax=Pseudomonas sp. PSKL.D1 TaxID=3029060 RepID=UPI0023817C98|nr:hypothetical protein [Pseudomonas sp. PSKL.D1]WDY58450.1 hypothetical protein PVV54_02080 [Pseudomonas sp. PSKL.D1]